MKRDITETPEKWVILKLPNGHYKVFGTWASNDAWKLNSGIEKVEQDKDYYYFSGFSGSCYKCSKKSYGVATSFTAYLLNNIIEKSEEQIEIMENVGKWEKLI